MKRGNATWVLIGGCIAVAIFVIVLFGGGKVFTDQSKFFKWIFPKFDDKKNITNIEIIRYDISNGEVKYYDGTNWYGFKDATLGNKKVNSNILRRDFERFYFENEREKNSFELNQYYWNVMSLTSAHNGDFIDARDLTFFQNFNDNGKVIIISDEFYFPENSGIREGFRKDLEFSLSKKEGKYKSGDADFLIVFSDRKLGPGASFILGIDNSLAVEYYDRNGRLQRRDRLSYYRSDLLKGIINSIKEWRDSVFKKPGVFEFEIDEGEYKQYFCTRVADNRYIVVDLSKGVDSDAEC